MTDLLNQMTKGLTLDTATKELAERKAKASGPRLTPVGVESAGIKPSIPPDMPGHYMSKEQLAESAVSLRAIGEDLIAKADALDLLAGNQTVPVVDEKAAAAAAKKQEEREADARALAAAAAKAPKSPVLPDLNLDADDTESFAERQTRLAAEAQAHVFASLDAPAEEPDAPTPPAADGSWECPEHGSEAIQQLTSRRGRPYSACGIPGCERFQK